MTLALEMRGITKRFPGVVANDRVDFDLRVGEIHALLGENGAGKSTLMNVLSGLYHPDEGEIVLRGRPVRFESPHQAIAAGIGMVHQHFMLVPTLTVAENIMLGAEVTLGPGLLDHAEAHHRILGLSSAYRLAVDPRALVGGLPVGVQQRVEILKALFRDADVLVLDEPTAVLTPGEADDLFGVIRRLVAGTKPRSVVFISHKLREVLALADRITVLRAGRVVGTTTPREATEESLAAMMVGRPVLLRVRKEPARPGEPVLTVDGLTVVGDRGNVAVDGVSLEVRAGEVLGIAGVEGNGQTELVEALTGLRPIRSGSVLIDGHDYANAIPRRITEAGSAHVPEDRQEDGLVLAYSIADNLVLNTYYLAPFARGFTLNEEAINENATKLVKEYDVRTPSPYIPVANLSGGNKQKVIIARELSRPVKLLIAAQPTRGVDVGSIEFIHKTIVAQRDRGVAVLVISAELDEIMSLSDRIAVMYHGKIVAIVPAAEATREDLGLLMAGAQPEVMSSKL
ncbi:MAG TPA: ABC transporter ATP-binding protein [Chloroflexota bacterium]|nr:ABC transporter ATP-binding protein [Chloroflexota bacterium]